jgi:hypothetical protein
VAPPQIIYTEDAIRKLVQNDSLMYEKNKASFMKEFFAQ